MKYNKILITFIATIVLASQGLEGMETEKKLLDVPDDCMCHILGFCNINEMLNFGVASKENLRLADKFWSNPVYCGNRVVAIRVNKNTKESSLEFCERHPNWPYSITLDWARFGDKYAPWFFTSHDVGQGVTTDEVNKILKACTNIKKLSFFGCKQVKFGEIHWHKLCNLEHLNVGVTNLTTEILNKKILKFCTKIKQLNLSSCKQIKCEEVDWQKLPNLEFLMLGGTNLTAWVLNKNILPFCKKIKKLNFDETEYGVVDWQKLPDLVHLNVYRHTNLTTEVLNKKILPFCKKIKQLSFEFECEQIKLEEVHWHKLRNLEHLDVGSTLTAEILNKKILKFCTKIKHLNTGEYVHIKCEEIDWQKLPNLEYLTLRNTNLTAEVLNKRILPFCKKIKKFYFYRLPKYYWELDRPEYWEIDWQKLSNLEHLDVANLTTEILNKKILKFCTKIKHLSLPDCEQIKLGEIHWHKLRNLEHLHAVSTNLTTEILNKKILKFCTKIKLLNIRGCKQIKFGEIRWHKLPFLEKLYFDWRQSRPQQLPTQALLFQPPLEEIVQQQVIQQRLADRALNTVQPQPQVQIPQQPVIPVQQHVPVQTPTQHELLKECAPHLFKIVSEMILEKNTEGIEKFVARSPVGPELMTYVNPKTKENLLHVAVRSDNPEMVTNILKLVNIDNFKEVMFRENKNKQNLLEIAGTKKTEESKKIERLIHTKMLMLLQASFQQSQQPPLQPQPPVIPVQQPVVQQTVQVPVLQQPTQQPTIQVQAQQRPVVQPQQPPAPTQQQP